MNFGIMGEARCVVTRADGSTRLDTGYQKNLVLNQGLYFFGGGKGTNINESCVIGAGNSTPVATQTALDSYIAIANGTDIIYQKSYTPTGDGLYKIWEQKRYRFIGLGNVNISELGLVSTGGSSNYYLTTRVLTKDSLGVPTAITLKTGETLDVYYKIYKVVDTNDKAFAVNVVDGGSGAVPYNVVVRPFALGDANYGVSSYIRGITKVNSSTADILPITTASGTGNTTDVTGGTLNYVAGEYKGVININFKLDDSNMAIRSINTINTGWFNFMPFQLRFGRVSDDLALVKTNKDILTVPIEINWGRYEGAL